MFNYDSLYLTFPLQVTFIFELVIEKSAGKKI